MLHSLIIEKFKKEEVLVNIEYLGEGIFDVDLDVDDFTKNVTGEFSRVRNYFIFYVSCLSDTMNLYKIHSILDNQFK